MRFCKIPFWVLIVMLSAAGTAHAQFNGLHLKGDAGLDSGSQAPLGAYWGTVFYWYDTSRINKKVGDQVNPAGNFNLFAGLPLVSVTTKKKFLGANYVFITELPPGRNTQTQSTDKTTSQKTSAVPDGAWHLIVAPYLWFPGVHGTVGFGGRSASIHASTADLLSHFRFGLMGTAELRHKHLLLPIDMMWIRLEDDKALPFPGLGESSADVKVSQVILSPKIGYRVVDRDALKVDALTGVRYWHTEQSLQFDPSGTKLSGSLNWVDPLVGGRIQAALSPKVSVTIAGDVGGWGAGSQLGYNVSGLLGYRIKPSWTLHAGYRYLDVNYRSGGVIFDAATSGVLFGVSVNLK